jgi:hypothetical protein
VNKLSFYEQVGIVIPGAVFLFVTMFYVPELRNVLGKDGVNLGGLGVFVLIAYAVGNLLGAVGNLIEAAYWRTRGGCRQAGLSARGRGYCRRSRLSDLKLQ